MFFGFVSENSNVRLPPLLPGRSLTAVTAPVVKEKTNCFSILWFYLFTVCVNCFSFLLFVFDTGKYCFTMDYYCKLSVAIVIDCLDLNVIYLDYILN